MRPPKPLGAYLLQLDLERITKPVDTTLVIPTFVQWRDK
jgi:hypothetical protein